MAEPTNAQLASQITSLLTRWNAREAEFRDWLAGTATGGPNGDGRYPLTNASGVSALVDAPAKLADTIGGPAGLSVQAKLLAEAARDITLGYRDGAANDAAQANAAKSATIDARDITKVYRDDAAAFAANLQVTRNASASSAESAQLARDEAVAAKATAVSAKSDTLIARSEAVTARDQAQGYAASINPAILATKADLASEVAKLVDSAPETLNTLKEFATALGNDPNFATTLTTKLAGKAALSHTHGISEIIGLQTALDGKQPVGSYYSTSGGTLTGMLTAAGGNEAVRLAASAPYVSFFNGAQSTRLGYIQHNASDLCLQADVGRVLIQGRNVLAELDAKQPSGSYAAALHSHNTFDIVDSRNAYRTPDGSAGTALTAEFTDKLPGLGDWHSLLNVKGWTNGYTSWQLIGPSSTTPHENLYFRSGVGTTWGALRKVWHSGNFDPATKQAAGNYLQYGAANPAGDVDINGNVTFRAVRNQLVSQYDPTTTQGIWAMGASYTLPAGNSNNYGSLYGLAWSYEPNYGAAGNNPQSKAGLSHQLLIQHGGVTKTAIGNGIWTVGGIAAGGDLYVNGNGSQPIRPNRLYRREDASDYSVQHHWTGTHWWLRGYVGDTFHAECRVGFADSAGNAATLGGYGVQEAAGGSSIPVRSGAGYLFATYFNQSSAVENPAVASFFTDSGDGYLRKASVAHIKATLGVRNITVSATQPSGMAAGDIWLQPI